MYKEKNIFHNSKYEMNRFKELLVWQKAVEMSISIYQITDNFPAKEVYGLTSQLRRSAVSIPSNLAEGAGRNKPREFVNFIGIALGSAFELETQLIIAQKVGLINEIDFSEIIKQLVEIQNMLYGLKKSLIKG